MEIETSKQTSKTNCVDCDRYKQLGEVCVIEHGKKFLWEYCKDFQAEVKLPDYNDLMKAVKHDMAFERRKIKEKKKKEILARRKVREREKKEKLRLKRSKIAKRVWEKRRKKMAQGDSKKRNNRLKERVLKSKDSTDQAKTPRTASSAKATV